jgi:hypothetical protein
VKTSTSGLRTHLHGSTAGQWSDLYVITLVDTTVYAWGSNLPAALTYTSTIDSTSRTYSVAGSGSVPGIERSEISERMGLDVDELKITFLCGEDSLIGAVRPEVAALAGTLAGATVTVERLYYSDSSYTQAGAVYRYNGAVADVRVEAGRVELTIASPLSALSRTLPRNFYTPLCGHSLFDAGCALTKATYTNDRSGDYYSADGITATTLVITTVSPVAEWVVNFIATATLTNGSTWNVTCTSVTGTLINYYTFTLDQPQPVGAMVTGTSSISITARCDKTIAKCRDKFGNLTRRRGFDFVPAADEVTRNASARTWEGAPAHTAIGTEMDQVLVASASESRFTAQTAAYGRPIPIVLGTQRIGGNIVLAGTYFTNQTDYAGTPISAGLVQLALCEGPIASVPKCWIEKTLSTPAGKGWTIITGARTQSPWATLSASNPDVALGYAGTALVCDPSGWAQSAVGELEKASYVVKGIPATGRDDPDEPGRGDYDLEAGSIIEKLLTNTDWGLGLTLPLDYADLGNFVNAALAHMSLAIVEERGARDIIADVVRAACSEVIFSEGTLRFIPLCTEKVVGTDGITFTYIPNVTPVYDLGSRAQGSDFLADEGEAPVAVELRRSEDRFNCFPVEYTSRSSARVTAAGTTLSEPQNEYRLALFDGEADPTDAALRGVIKAPVTSLPCITRLPHAKLLSRLLAKQSASKTATFRFRLGWRFALLEVGDLVTLTESNLGLSRMLVRIAEIKENDGDFDVVAEMVDYLGTVPTATYTVS